MGVRGVWGLEFGVSGGGFGVWGVRFRVVGLGFGWWAWGLSACIIPWQSNSKMVSYCGQGAMVSEGAPSMRHMSHTVDHKP